MLRYSLLIGLLFTFTACIAGKISGGIPKIGVKDYYDWDAFVAGDREIMMIAFTRFPTDHVEIVPIASYEGTSLPASLELALVSDKAFSGRAAVIEEAYVLFKRGERIALISQDSPRKAQFQDDKREDFSFSRVVFDIPDSITKRQDYTVYATGYIEGPNGRVRFEEKAGVYYSSEFVVLPFWAAFFTD